MWVLGTTESEEGFEFWIHVGLQRSLCGVSIAYDASLTSRVVGLEGRVGSTESIRFTYFQGFNVAIVTGCKANCGNNGAISLGEATRLNLGSGCGLWRVVVNCCLRSPVPSCDGCDYCLSFITDNGIRDNRFHENAIRQTKRLGVQIEISFGRWIIAGLSWRPLNIGEWRSWDTVFLVTKIVVVWRIFPYLAIIGFGRTTDISWRATPERIWAGILWCNLNRVCGHWASYRL